MKPNTNEIEEKEYYDAVNKNGNVLVVESVIYETLLEPTPHHFHLYYRGGEFMRVAGFENEGDPKDLGEEVFDTTPNSSSVDSFENVVLDDDLKKWILPSEETPVDDRIDWDWVEKFAD